MLQLHLISLTNISSPSPKLWKLEVYLLSKRPGLLNLFVAHHGEKILGLCCCPVVWFIFTIQRPAAAVATGSDRWEAGPCGPLVRIQILLRPLLPVWLDCSASLCLSFLTPWGGNNRSSTTVQQGSTHWRCNEIEHTPSPKQDGAGQGLNKC